MMALAVMFVSVAVIVVAALHHVRVMDAREREDDNEPVNKELGPTPAQAMEIRKLAEALWCADDSDRTTKRQAFEKACRMKGFEPWGGPKKDVER